LPVTYTFDYIPELITKTQCNFTHFELPKNE